MKSILICLFGLLACLVVLASSEHTIKTKSTSKDSLVLESTNNEDTLEFMFKNSEHFPLIGVKVIRQVPISSNSSSNQQSSSGSQSQQSNNQTSSSQTSQVQPQTSSQMQPEQANSTAGGSSTSQQQSSAASSQAASQQASQSSNQTQAVEKQDNPQAQSSSQAGSQGTSSSSQASTPQSGSNQNSTAGSSSTSQSSQQGSSSSSQSTSQTSPISNDTSISGDHDMNLTPNNTQSAQPSDNSTVTIQPSMNITNMTSPNTTFINETIQSIGVSNSTEKDVNITDIIGRIISGENITEIINSTLGNLTQWLNSTLYNNTQDVQQSKRTLLRRRLLSLLESSEDTEDYAQYLKFNKLKLLSNSGETIKEIPLSDSNINWNYGHSVVVNNEQAFKIPHVDVEIPLSTSSNRPTLKIRTMMTEAPSHVERNGRHIQLNPRSMDIQISLNNLQDLLSEKEKKLSGTKWSIETEMKSTSNSLQFMQTKSLNGVQKVVVMGNNLTPKGQFTFNSSPHMKVIQDSDNDALISIQIHDSSNSIQLNPIKFGVL